MVTEEQLKFCQAKLQKRQSVLIKQVKDHYGTSLEMAEESTGELSHYDNHPADMGTEQFEREKDLALNEHAEKELEAINEALHAIEEGTYGICKECGEDIPFERLQVFPTADCCVNHAHDNEHEHHRPVEEQVMSPNSHTEDLMKKSQVGYDGEDAWREVSHYGTSETPSDFYGDRKSDEELSSNRDERVSSAEDIEEFLGANAEGYYTGVIPNHKKYEEKLDHDD